MPGAGRTRAPCVQGKCTLRTQATTGQPEQPAFPARWFTAYTWSPRSAGLVSLRRLQIACTLDPSVGGSGPHDFARPYRTRSPVATCPSIASRFQRLRRLAKRPSRGIRIARREHVFLKNESQIFFARGLNMLLI